MGELSQYCSFLKMFWVFWCCMCRFRNNLFLLKRFHFARLLVARVVYLFFLPIHFHLSLLNIVATCFSCLVHICSCNILTWPTQLFVLKSFRKHVKLFRHSICNILKIFYFWAFYLLS